MKICSDWHIHSRNSCDQACMTIADLVREATAKGVRDFGITDHLHTPYNLPEIDFERVEQLLERAGLRDDFWCLDPSTCESTYADT